MSFAGRSDFAVPSSVNATNEITTIARDNAAGAPEAVSDDFATSIADIYTKTGTWSISTAKVNVDTLSSGEAKLMAGSEFDFGSLETKITFPTGSSTNKAGIIFSDDGSNNYYAVVLDRNAGKIALYQVTSGSWGSALASTSTTIADES